MSEGDGARSTAAAGVGFWRYDLGAEGSTARGTGTDRRECRADRCAALTWPPRGDTFALPHPAPPMPAFTIYAAQHLEPLAAHLAASFAESPLPPLQREVILVGENKGVRVWLEHRLAEAHGCAASLQIQSPFAFAAALARKHVPGAPSASRGTDHPFDLAALSWRLRALLDELPEAADGESDPYAALRAYLARTDAPAALASRLAVLFDGYQLFRPEALAAWRRGENVTGSWAHEPWQAALWRGLCEGTELPDRAQAFEALARRLETGAAPRGLPPRLTVFGARLLLPLYYRLLSALARHIPVTLYAAAPGLPEDPYARDGFEHPLLQDLGEHTGAYVEVLRGMGAPPLVWVDADARQAAPRRTPGVPALVALHDALECDAPPSEPAPLDPRDRSLSLIDAHSPTRELEVLRDHLLDAFDTLEGLRPSDVLVLVPDVATYAPLIDVVFGAESVGGASGGRWEKRQRIPYHVAEHPHAPARRVLEAFVRGLSLPAGRVRTSDLLGLLDAPAVARAAGIHPEEAPRLRPWLDEAGIRWGVDASTREAFGLPLDDTHTWRFGLTRLLLGFAMGTCGDESLPLGHLPCDAPGLDGADLLGRFSEWADGLFSDLRALARPRPLDEWPEALRRLLDHLLAPESDEEHQAVQFLRASIAGVAELQALAREPGEAVGFSTVRAHLEGRLGAFDDDERYLTGAVTFAPPFPLRHAPHRVVAFLGLGASVFPSQEARAGYDLVQHAPQPGDRAPRQAEKQLFVDALMSARERFIASFVGRSERDNAPQAASVVLDAFRETLRAHWGEAAEQFAEVHPLQPFAPAYFGGDPARFTYAAQYAPRASAEPPRSAPAFLPARDLAAVPPPRDPPRIDLADLAEAWAHPTKHFAKKRLRIRLDDFRHSLHDDEPLLLGGLDMYGLKAALLEGLLSGQNIRHLSERLRAQGALPAGQARTVALREAYDAVLPLAAAISRHGDPAPHALSLTLSLSEAEAETEVVGAVSLTAQHVALRYRPGHVRARDLVEAWVHHLALCATSERPASARFFGTDHVATFEPVEPEAAGLYLQALARDYDALRTRPPALFEKASWTYAKRSARDETDRYADAILQRESEIRAQREARGFESVTIGSWTLGQAKKSFYLDPYNPGTTDQDDAYVRLVTRGADPFDEPESFALWSMRLYAPLLRYYSAS